MKQKTAKIGFVMLTLVLMMMLVISGCTKNQPGTEPEPEGPSEQQEPQEEDRDITRIAPVDEVSTDNLTLLNRTDADFDGDGTAESIELFTSAQKDAKGEIMWDDGQKWLLLARDSGKDFVLYDDYIQLGVLKFWFYTDHAGQYHISTLLPASSGLYFTDYAFDADDSQFIKKTIYEAEGINLIYSSTH